MKYIPSALAAVLLFSGCVTKYVVISEVPKSRLEVVVFTDDADKGGELLEALSDRGYDNEQNHVATMTDDEPAIKWGGAPSGQIEEIAAFIEGRYEVELERSREFKLDDYNVFITLPLEDDEPRGEVEREDLRVVIFTDDEDKGDELLAGLRSLGFSNDENYVTDEPNDEFNIKWGAAPDDAIDEITGLVDSLLGVTLARTHSFENDDKDVFVNLPFLASQKERTRADFEITVFCDSEELGKGLLKQLAELGYTNDESEVLSGPNEDANMKYGALPDSLAEEIAELVETQFKVELRRSKEFDDGSDQVFINLLK